MNDNDRTVWVDNDEGLYDLWCKSGLSMREFVRKNRALIDDLAEKVKTGAVRQHALKYGP